MAVQRTTCKLVLPIAGLSVPLVVFGASVLLAGYLAMGSDAAALVFPPVLVVAFLVLALLASVLASLAEVDVVIGNDGLRLGLLFGRTRLVRFSSLTDLQVHGDRVTLVRGTRTQRLYLRPGAFLRGLQGALVALYRLQRYKSGLPDRHRSSSPGTSVYAASVSLRMAWEEFRAQASEASALASKLRVDLTSGNTSTGGYRVAAIGDDDLAEAVREPGLLPEMRIEAARALLRVDPERAVRVAVDAAGATCDDALERELAGIRSGEPRRSSS